MQKIQVWKRFVVFLLACVCIVGLFDGCASNKSEIEPQQSTEVTVSQGTEPTEGSVETQPDETEPQNVPEGSDPNAVEPTEGDEEPTNPNEHTETKDPVVPIAETVYVIEEVNVRTGPSTKYEKVGVLVLGDSIQRVEKMDDGWSKIIYNGEERYAHSSYLSTEMPLAADPTHVHEYSDSVIKPTCERKGYTEHKCECGKSYNDNHTEKKSHDYEKKTVKPTCKTAGYDSYKCKSCGYSYKKNETKKLGHKYDVKTIAPTYTEKGYDLHKCTACGSEKKDNYTDVVPHDHEYDSKVVNPTCTAKGYTEFTCKLCKASHKSDYTDKLPHTYNETVIEPKCTEKGYTESKCTVCGNTTKSNETTELGHKYVTETVAPNSKDKGYDKHTCSVCGDIYKDNYKDPIVTYKNVDETVYAKSEVNIRTGPSTDYKKIGSLAKNKSIKRVGIGDNGWSQVMYNDEVAYISSNYLTTTKPTTSTSGYPKTYSDDTCKITIYKEWYKNAYVYAAHIEFTDYDRFGTACANGKYNKGTETTSHAAKRLGAIFTVNGCYSAPSLDYTVVRQGKIWNGSGRKSFWCPAVYSSKNGLLLSAWESGGTPGIAGGQIDKLVADGKVTDTFCFGPPNLSNGEICGPGGSSRAQRTFIGTNGKAGDIWVCVSDGRYNDGKSAGLTFREAAQYLKSKGCTFGVHLDGGGSSTMYFNGVVLNAAKGNQRSVVDFVYFK